jgi:hypothetical protein
VAIAGNRLLLLLFGQHSLQHITGFGDVREIDFGCDALLGTGTLAARMGRGARAVLKVRAHLVGLVVLQRTGVSLAGGQAELCQYVKNLPTLDFHLAREIVDTNLTHPPLFNWCCPKPLVAHSYLMALAVLDATLIA